VFALWVFRIFPSFFAGVSLFIGEPLAHFLVRLNVRTFPDAVFEVEVISHVFPITAG